MSENLITMDGIKKVFFTDEVETHALSEIHLTVGRGEYVSIAGPSGCGKSTLLSILAAGYADGGPLYLEWSRGGQSRFRRAGTHSQPRDRLYFPELQPDRRSHRLREC